MHIYPHCFYVFCLCFVCKWLLVWKGNMKRSHGRGEQDTFPSDPHFVAHNAYVSPIGHQITIIGSRLPFCWLGLGNCRWLPPRLITPSSSSIHHLRMQGYVHTGSSPVADCIFLLDMILYISFNEQKCTVLTVLQTRIYCLYHFWHMVTHVI